MLTDKELEAIKPHLNAENAAKVTADNGVELLTNQMVALSQEALKLSEQAEKAGQVALDRLEIDPDALDAHVESAETKLSQLVTNGAITPAVQKALSAVLIGAENSRNVYALSRKATGGAKSITNLVLDALKDNKPVKTGEKTGPQSQTRELSRNADEEKELAKAQEIMANAANHELKK